VTRLRWTLLGVAAGVAIIGGLWVPSAQRDRDRAQDVARIRSLYELFPTHPAARLVGEEIHEQREDGVPNGRFELTIAYRFLDGVDPSRVLAFYRDHLPPGWSAVTDDNCRGPQPTEHLPDDWVLYDKDTALTTFASPDGEPVPEGVTFTLLRDAGGTKMVLSLPTFTCGVPEPS
jgi:hypothetical protein